MQPRTFSVECLRNAFKFHTNMSDDRLFNFLAHMLKSIIYLIFTIEIYNFPCVAPMGLPPPPPLCRADGVPPPPPTLSHNTHTHVL